MSTSQVTLSSFKHIEADSEARLTLDRISYDVTKMVQRGDVDYYFPATQNGNDQFYFFTESTGYFLNSSVSPAIPNNGSTTVQKDPRGEVSLVGYRINPATNKLERLSKGLIWNGVGGGVTGVDGPMIYLPQTISATWPSLATSPASDYDFQCIGDGVFRLSLSYLVENTGLSHTTPNPTPTPAQISTVPNLEGIAPGQTGYFNPKDVLAIVVSIAVLDPSSQRLIPASTLNQSLSNAALALQSPSSSTLPLTNWEANIFNLGLPKEAASQVRVYQRFCYLNHSPN